LVGLVSGFLDAGRWLFCHGRCVLAGLWTFAYDFGRTPAGLDAHDMTKRRFGFALPFFALLWP
jgi:hypothetical protein